MHFARLTLPADRRDPRLPTLLGAAELDVLQLDYPRPPSAQAPDDQFRPLPDFATGFVQQISDLNAALYLNPQLRVLTSAGWGHAYGCVETIAGQLVDGGNGDLVVAAVRGSNLLPILEDLQADGVDLSNVPTGDPFQQLTGDVVAADLQIGAGPLAAAILEGAQIVVAGFYDADSPIVAAAKAEFGWSWEDFDRLAAANVAARVVHAPLFPGEAATPGESLWAPRTARIRNDAAATVSAPSPRKLQAEEIQGWLETQARSSGGSADVSWDLSQLECRQISPHDVELAGIRGCRGAERWKLDIRHTAEYSTEFWIAEGDPAGLRFTPLLPLQQYFLGLELPNRRVSAEMLRSAGAGQGGVLRVGCRSASWGKCREFADLVQAALARDPRNVWSSPADVEVSYGLWQAEIPRNGVDIAVDARPAREWL